MATRAESYATVKSLRDEGLLQREIAIRTGLSRSYVASLLSDPTGDLDRRRKADYAGTCESCGGPTSGSEGPAMVRPYCRTCSPRMQRKWTRERVIEAIREWARRFGSAPSSADWGVNGGKHRCRIAADGYEFPWASSVYNSTGGEYARPFDSWADAIEAAGFPRPSSSRNYVNKDHWRVENMSPSIITRQYLVFRVEDDGRLALFSECEARTTSEAVEQVVSEPGRFAAVAKSSLTEYTVRSRFVASPNGASADEPE